MEREAAIEAYAALHGEDAAWHDGTFTRWSKSRSAEFPYPALAGVSIGVAATDIAPHDQFTTRRDASPFASVAQQAPGEQHDADAGSGEGQQPEGASQDHEWRRLGLQQPEGDEPRDDGDD